jgi:hypothetical protein
MKNERNSLLSHQSSAGYSLGCFQIERKISKNIKEKRITTVILHLNPIFNNKKSPILFFCADY